MLMRTVFMAMINEAESDTTFAFDSVSIFSRNQPDLVRLITFMIRRFLVILLLVNGMFTLAASGRAAANSSCNCLDSTICGRMTSTSIYLPQGRGVEYGVVVIGVEHEDATCQYEYMVFPRSKTIFDSLLAVRPPAGSAILQRYMEEHADLGDIRYYYHLRFTISRVASTPTEGDQWYTVVYPYDSSLEVYQGGGWMPLSKRMVKVDSDSAVFVFESISGLFAQ
jgi:hypothetical protein